MKKVLFLLLIFFVITSNVFSLQQNLQYQEESLSFSISPSTPLLMLPFEAEEGNPNPFLLVGISVNLGRGNVEHDWFLSLYPSEYSFGYERRFFPSSKKQGFFYGFFASIDYRKFKLLENGILIDLFIFPTENNFSTLGLRFGPEIGFRIKINDFGITPKFGIGIPLYHPFGLKNISDDFWRDYLLTVATSSIFVGIKIDFLDCYIED